MLKPGIKPTEEVRAELYRYCEKYVAKYAIPKRIEFRDMLPKTLVGKVAYRDLEGNAGKRRSDLKSERKVLS